VATASATDLQAYENSSDVFTHDFSEETVGDEVAFHLSHHVSWTIDRPAADVWPSLKDLNAWMQDLEYSTVVGDAPQTSTLTLKVRPDFYGYYEEHYGLVPDFVKTLVVRRIEPEKVLLLEEPTGDNRGLFAYYLLTLHEHDGRTTVISEMTYAPQWVPKGSADQTRTALEHAMPEVSERWKERYIPRLRQLVAGG
jgi:hypothetical protein